MGARGACAREIFVLFNLNKFIDARVLCAAASVAVFISARATWSRSATCGRRFGRVFAPVSGRQNGDSRWRRGLTRTITWVVKHSAKLNTEVKTKNRQLKSPFF